MFDGDERGEKIDLKENTAPSGEESFMLRLDQKRPFAFLVSALFVLLLCCQAANKDLGEDILAHGQTVFQRREAVKANVVEYQIDNECKSKDRRPHDRRYKASAGKVIALAVLMKRYSGNREQGR